MSTQAHTHTLTTTDNFERQILSELRGAWFDNITFPNYGGQLQALSQAKKWTDIYIGKVEEDGDDIPIVSIYILLK